MNHITLDQHLAWPETRTQHLVTWLNRPIEGWDSSSVIQRLYHWIEQAEDHEAHF